MNAAEVQLWDAWTGHLRRDAGGALVICMYTPPGSSTRHASSTMFLLSCTSSSPHLHIIRHQQAL